MALKIVKVNDARTAEEFAGQAARAYAAKDLPRAKASMLSALGLEPENGRLYTQLGPILMELDEWDRALVTAKRAVELQPYEADAYNLLGCVLFKLRWFVLAESAFRRALDFDPDHQGAQGNVVAAIREAKLCHEQEPPEFDSIRALLEIKPPTISLCMIVKNEEKFLAECLESAQGAVDEICIVDTGSTDKTVEIARRFGARIEYLEWTGDFATARNKSIEMATSDWILILDADETITPESRKELRRVSRDKSNCGYSCVIENLLGNEAGDGSQLAMIFRFFQNRPDLRYEGIIHEQIIPSVQRTGLPNAPAAVRIIHKGYLNQYLVERDKQQRNLAILLKQDQDDPDNPYCHFNLGQTYKLLEEPGNGLRHYQRALELLKANQTEYNIPYYGSLYFSYSELLREEERFADALAMAEEGLANFPHMGDLHFVKGSTLLAMGRYEDALKVFEGCRKFVGHVFPGGTDPAVATYKSTNAIGVCYSKLGKNTLAKQYFRRALREWPKPNAEIFANLGIISLAENDLAQAMRYFTQSLDIDSGNYQAWINLGSVCYRQGNFGEAVAAWRQGLILRPGEPNLEFLIGEALLKQRLVPAAIEAFEAELAVSPDHPSAMLGLGITQYLSGRPQDAQRIWQDFISRQPDSERLPDFRSTALFVRAAHGTRLAAEDLRQCGMSPELVTKQWAQLLDLSIQSQLYDQVEAIANQSAVISEVLPTFEEVVGHLFLKWEVWDLAAAFLLRQQERTPENPELYFLLGEACAGLGNVEDGLVMYQTCLDLNPRHPVARMRQAKLARLTAKPA